jgi:Flp pilus assembly pilin Flp
MITAIEYFQLFALIAFAGFISYTVHEVGNAVQSILHEND